MTQKKTALWAPSEIDTAEKLPPGTKGAALCRSSHGTFSLKGEQVSLPCAVIKQSAITNNIHWMQSFAEQHQVQLCPHGKTTMTPGLFAQQLAAGAWGITVANAVQAEAAIHAGAMRVIIANQVVGRVNMQLVIQLMQQHQVTIYVCVDSAANLDSWSKLAKQSKVTLPILIEFGVAGGRCGCRTRDQVIGLAKQIQDSDSLELCGIEVYEGVIQGEHAEHRIREFLQQTADTLIELKTLGLCTQSILSGAGSAWYDVVAEEFSQISDVTAVIRPGCYAVHDTGIYQAAQHEVNQRGKANGGVICDLGGDLISSLEVWAYVLSVPEASKAIIGVGKRDVAFDAGLPKIERVIRNGVELDLGAYIESNSVMDQHLSVSMTSPELEVGDIVVMSTSHPCLTFDKWRYVAVADDNDNVTHWMQTYF